MGPPVTRLNVCLYRTPGDGGGLPVGRFASGRTITGPSLRRLLRALHTAPPAAGCDRRHTCFAVLHPAAGEVAYVEADGCHRLLRPDGNLGQLDAVTVRHLTAGR